MSDPAAELRAAMAEHGIVTDDDIVSDGALRRIHVDGDTGGDHNGWYVLHADGIAAGAYGCWRRGISKTWSSRSPSDMTAAERDTHRERMDAIRRDRDAERERIHAEARERAARIWREAQPETGEHRYLRDRGVQAYGIRTDGQRLVIPLHDTDGTLHSIQHIDPRADKRYLAGGRVSGCYHGIGRPNGVLCICEGYATGATIHEATGHAVAVAFDAGNLGSVTVAQRAKYPELRLVVCADDDYRTAGNPGVTAATAAARAVGGLLVIPEFGVERPDGASDCNDLARHRGLDAVRDAVDRATAPAVGEHEPQSGDTTATAAEADTAATIARLAGLPPIEYDRVRQTEAERLGIRVGTLDAEVSRLRPQSETGADAGQAVLFDLPPPWPDPVDGATLLRELAETLTRHAVLPAHADTAVALWVLLTYTHEAASVCPILALTSPEKRCGKTTALSLLRRLCHRPLAAANITAAALFRAVEQWQPCLLIDEADTFLRQSDELRGIINSGHTRDTAYVIRTVGEDHEPRRFATWAPKAIACIGEARDTIMDRSIVIAMRRKLPSEAVTRLRYDDRYHDLASRCARWAADHIDTLRAAEPDLPAGLHDRAADNWTPLLAIADAAGGEWPQRAHEAARILSGGEAVEDTSTRVQLLADIHSVFEARGVDRLRSTDLVDALVDMEDRPWPEWRKGKPLTATQLARLLRPFGVAAGPRREAGTVYKGYLRSRFDDAFSRYLPSQAVTQLQPAVQSHSAPNPSGYTDTNVTARQTPKPAPHNGCNPVTAQHSDHGAKVWMTPASEIIPRANVRDPCPRCAGEGCRHCGDSGRRLHGKNFSSL